jgi:pyruvate dehydrogenase E1 component
MIEEGEPGFTYITLYNEPYPQPPMPEGSRDGILKGLYLYRAAPQRSGEGRSAQILGSGPLLREALRAQVLLGERFGVAADVWSATSYLALRRDARAVERWNLLHPKEEPRVPYLVSQLGATGGPVVAVSDYIRAVPDQIAPWLPGRWCSLGTDGFGRSDSRTALRRHFEIDAEHIAFSALSLLAREKRFPDTELPQVMKELGIDPDRRDPASS